MYTSFLVVTVLFASVRSNEWKGPQIDPASLPPLEYPATLGHLDFLNSRDGSYFFQYDTGADGPSSFRGESRDSVGTVTGYFGYIDPDGVLRVTHYRADSNGYRSTTKLRYLRKQITPT